MHACKEARMVVEARVSRREGEGTESKWVGGPRSLRTQKAITMALVTV